MRLELKNWTLTVIPHKDFMQANVDPRHFDASAIPHAVTVPATVPGNFELDLVRAGLLDDPFWGTNITKLRELEDRHLIYTTTFDKPEVADNETPVIRFDGIDTYAVIYVNGDYIGYADNMFMTFEVMLERDTIEELKATGNTLTVHIRPTMLESQKYPIPPTAGMFDHGYASLYVRKAASTFGWDIMARAVSGGLWRPVYIETVKTPAIRDVFLYTRNVIVSEDDPTRGYAELNLYYAVDIGGDTYYPFDESKNPRELPFGYKLTVEGTCNDCTYTACVDHLWHTCGNIFIPVHGAYLWYPKNAGLPYLYDVTVTLWRGDEAVDTYTLKSGIRTVELDRSSLSAEGDRRGEFRFLINHRPVFVMGTNWVPLDAFHSRDAERLPRALELLGESGCNAVRCWGGNVYEDHAFFDYCDAHGILVWQDFAMGCSAYPCDETMQNNLRDEVEQVVKKLRNHTSLCLWAGDNECDLFWWMCYAVRRNPKDNVLTRKIIPEVLREQDLSRPYLPSSPYIDEEAAASGQIDRISEDHLWGPRDYFKGPFYRNTVCHFASETGYHGCPAPASLRKFIPEEELWPIFDGATAENPLQGAAKPSWLAHQTSMELNENNVFGYRIRLMTSQVQNMFTDMPLDLDTYARMSQASQAEAFKYFIERFRTTKWRRTGIIWWNLLDGWSQVSDAVVGYDFMPKLAYHFIKRVQKPQHMSFTDPENGRITLMGINDSQKPAAFTYTVKDVTNLPVDTDLATVPTLLSGSVTVPADAVAPAATLSAEGLDHRFLLIEWTLADGITHKSHFILEPEHLDSEMYMTALDLCGFDDWQGF